MGLRIVWFAAAVAALLPPLLLSDYIVFRFSMALVWMIALLGLVLLSGISGQFSFAHPVFYGIGGYVAAMLANHTGLTVYLALPGAVLAGFLAGYLTGRVTGGQSLWTQALVTFALVMVFPQILRWPVIERFTGGSSGLYLELGGAPADLGISADKWWYGVCLACLAVGLLLARNLIAGRSGRAMQAVRDHELAAICQGIPVRHVSAMAFGCSGAYAALAGCLAAIQYGYVGPGTYGFALSVQFLVGLVIGGMGSLGGALIGGLFLQFFPGFVAELGKGLSHLLYAVLLIVAIIVMPHGVAGLVQRLIPRRPHVASG